MVYHLSEEGTLLVAFTKMAMQESFLSKGKPMEEQYDVLMEACYLYNCFLKRTNSLRDSFNFTIHENGPKYGKFVNVQLGTFNSTVKKILKEKANSLPTEYRLRIEQYMKDPFSDKGKELSENAKSKLFPNNIASSYLKKMHIDYKRDVKNMDFMFTLFK